MLKMLRGGMVGTKMLACKVSRCLRFLPVVLLEVSCHQAPQILEA